MKMSARFDFVPVVEVSTDNFSEAWPFMIRSIRKSSFVAVDTVRVCLLKGFQADRKCCSGLFIDSSTQLVASVLVNFLLIS